MYGFNLIGLKLVSTVRKLFAHMGFNLSFSEAAIQIFF